MGNNQSTEQIRSTNKAGLENYQSNTALHFGQAPAASLRRIDLSTQDRPSPSPFASPALLSATLSTSSPALPPAILSASSSRSSRTLPPARLSTSSSPSTPSLSPALSAPAASSSAASSVSSLASSPALLPPTPSLPATSPRSGATGQAKGKNGTNTSATHMAGRPLSVIAESVWSESIYSEARPRNNAGATKASESARRGIADFSSYLVSASAMDVGTAIMLLREIKKHASPEDLIALRRALEPEEVSRDLDTGKLRRSSSCSSATGCIYDPKNIAGSQPRTTRWSSTPRLGSLICDEKTWAGRELLRSLTFLQDQPTPPHPECLLIVPPTPGLPSPGATGWHGDGQDDQGDSMQPSRETACVPYVAMTFSKQSPTTPEHPSRSDSLSPPPTGDSGYSSGSSGKSSSWTQYKAASRTGLVPRCESPLKMDTTDQATTQRYVALNSSSDSLSSSNYDGDRGSVQAVKLQNISPNRSSIVQKRPKKRPPPLMQNTKPLDRKSPRTKLSRRFSRSSACPTPSFLTGNIQGPAPVTHAALDGNGPQMSSKTPPHDRQLAELEADRPSRPSRPLHRRRRSICLCGNWWGEGKPDITQLAELEADIPVLSIYSRTRSLSLPRTKSYVEEGDLPHSEPRLLAELEADRPPCPPPRMRRRKSSPFVRKQTPFYREIPHPDARHFAELEAPRPTPLGIQSQKRESSPLSNRPTKGRLISRQSVADLGATANSLGSVLYDMTVTGIIPANKSSSKLAVQQPHHCQQRCRSLNDLKQAGREASRPQVTDAPSAPMIDSRKYAFVHTDMRAIDTNKVLVERKSMDTYRPERFANHQSNMSSSNVSLAINKISTPHWVSLPTTPLPTPPLPMTPSHHSSRKQSQISHLVARFEYPSTPTENKQSQELHRNASMPSMRHRFPCGEEKRGENRE